MGGEGAWCAESLREAFAEIAAGAPCVLLSSEHFERLDAAVISLLRRVLDGHAVEVLYFARRWSGLLPSAWQESVKHGSAETLPAFALGHLLQPFRSDILNYANVLDRYAAVFGADALRLASYDAVLEEGGTLLGSFLDRILGVSLPPDGAAERVNPALPPEDVEIMRVLNAMARRERGRAPGCAWTRLHARERRVRAIPPWPRCAPPCAVPSRRCASRTIPPRSGPWSGR